MRDNSILKNFELYFTASNLHKLEEYLYKVTALC